MGAFGNFISRIGGRFGRQPRTRRAGQLRQIRVRGFEGAENTRLLSGWQTQSEDINRSLYDSLGALRARSRDLDLNNDWVRRFNSLVRINVVGHRGIVLQARTIGRGGKPDKPANMAIEAAWSDWGRRKNCDVTECKNWLQMQMEAANSWSVDGEILARHVTGKAGGKYGYRLQHLDPEMLNPRYNGPGRGGSHILLGVERDQWSRVVAYHLRERSQSDLGYWGSDGKRYVRIPAKEILHHFDRDRVGQVRGYPMVSTSMSTLKQMDATTEAAIVAARAGASKMGFYQSQEGTQYSGDDVDADGVTVAEFESGVIEKLPYGVTFQGWDPNYPDAQLDPFMKMFLRKAAGAMGGGVSYSSLSGDVSDANYSSLRAGTLVEREAWKVMQESFVAGYIVPVYENWLKMALFMQQIRLVGNGLPLREDLYDKYLRVSWQPPRWDWVDPQKDIIAKREAVALGAMTVPEIIRERGQDPDDLLAEAAEWDQKVAESRTDQATGDGKEMASVNGN